MGKHLKKRRFVVLYFIVGIISYLIGSIPTGVLLSRNRYGIDVRETGSGNIGATNVVRTFGWFAGVFTLFADFLKGLVPLLILQEYYPGQPWLLTVSGVCLVFGHCFSLYLKLSGGKGVATSFGCVTAVEPMAALICAIFYGIFLLLTRISAVGSLVGVLVILIYVGVVKPAAPIKYMFFAIAAIIVVRHRSNIIRLKNDLLNRNRKKNPLPRKEL